MPFWQNAENFRHIWLPLNETELLKKNLISANKIYHAQLSSNYFLRDCQSTSCLL